MPHWNLAAVGSLTDAELATFDYIARQAADTYGIALHYERMSGPATDEQIAAAELEAMRHALCTAGPAFAAAALVHAVTHLADELRLTPEQRLTLNDAASALAPEVWARLTGAVDGATAPGSEES